MPRHVTRDSLLDAFFQRFVEIFRVPAEMSCDGWYSLADVSKLLGYENARAARNLIPETEISNGGRSVSETGVVYLALKARPTEIVAKVREVSQLAIMDLLSARDETPARMYELCDEIRSLLDKFAPRNRRGDSFSL